MANSRSRHEFRVVVNDINLNKEKIDKINNAIQKAAIIELADIDPDGKPWISFPLDGGPIRGMWLNLTSKEQLERAGIGKPELGGHA